MKSQIVLHGLASLFLQMPFYCYYRNSTICSSKWINTFWLTRVRSCCRVIWSIFFHVAHVLVFRMSGIGQALNLGAFSGNANASCHFRLTRCSESQPVQPKMSERAPRGGVTSPPEPRILVHLRWPWWPRLRHTEFFFIHYFIFHCFLILTSDMNFIKTRTSNSAEC